MSKLATILYEDKMQIGSGGAFPPHDLLLAMVADLTGRTIWELRGVVDKNPRNGVNKLIEDVSRASLLAGTGVLCVLVDSDRIAEHLGLPKKSPEAQITEQLLARCDAPEKLEVFYLHPNMEGLMRSIEECEPSMPAPSSKKHNLRDLYLNQAAFSVPQAVRDCVKSKQPSLAALIELLARLCAEA